MVVKTDPLLGLDRVPDLSTPRLRLRAVTMADFAWFLGYASRPEIVQGHGIPAPPGERHAREELQELFIDVFTEHRGIRWGIELASSSGLIGSVALHHWDRHADSGEIGYDLAAEHWGRGLASEAIQAVLAFGFERMRLNRVQAIVIVGNERSLRLAERSGFVREGVMRQHGVDEHGHYCDELLLSLLRGEWLAASRPRASR